MDEDAEAKEVMYLPYNILTLSKLWSWDADSGRLTPRIML